MDDDEAQREVLMEVLELEGVRVFAASTAEEAVRLLQEGPEVVLMDLHGVDVQPVRDALVRLPRRPSLLIVSGDLKLAEHAQSLGADGWLAKPYELDQLLAIVSDAVDRREGAAPAP